VGIDATVKPADFPPFHPGRCAAITADGATLGYAGELHPRVIEAMELPPRTVAVELNLDAILYAGVEARTAPEVGTFPVAKEDIALVVSDDVPAASVIEALRTGAGSLLESVRLFDEYRGDPVPAGHRSLAFALRFRASDRTLSAEETTQAREAAIAAAGQACGAVLR
jgi:phenylalanyl-tRNA synthetase beta chain